MMAYILALCFCMCNRDEECRERALEVGSGGVKCVQCDKTVIDVGCKTN